MGSMKTHVEQPKPNREVRNCRQFLFADRPMFTICIQENIICLISG